MIYYSHSLANSARSSFFSCHFSFFRRLSHHFSEYLLKISLGFDMSYRSIFSAFLPFLEVDSASSSVYLRGTIGVLFDSQLSLKACSSFC